MVEGAPQTKRNEQYPLLKVDGGGGDGGVHQQTSPTLAPGWERVRCSPKQLLIVRWPEYISACWMTMILLGISFVVFYTLGMAYRRQPVLVIKCNATKPASDVYYHHIVQGNSVPFSLYADYLAYMATQYPLLNYHVLFLMDDSIQKAFRGPRHTRFMNKIMPYTNGGSHNTYLEEDYSKQEVGDFESRYQNVNITIMSLSKFMSMTSLKFKWRTLPLSYITFYARVVSVWQNGGVGLDLNVFNNNFNNRKCVDRRISAILKQHNDGIKVEEYTSALNKIVQEEESELFNVFYGLIYQILNETKSFLSKSLPYPPNEKGVSQNEPLIRSQRNQRDVATQSSDQNNKSEIISNVYVETINSTNDTDLKNNEYQTLPNSGIFEKFKVNMNDAFKTFDMNKSHRFNDINKTEGLNKSVRQTEMMNKSDGPQVVMFYDFTVFSDSVGPPFIRPDPLMRTDFRQNVKTSEFGRAGINANNGEHLLSIDSEGLFVAAASRLHLFLTHLLPISSDCQLRGVHHKFAIHALLSQCPEILSDDYCNNIYLLY